MFEAIEAVARSIGAAWSRVHYADEHFCSIAAQGLDRPLDLDFEVVARRVCQGAALPPQRRLDEGFGQPALTLHSAERFTIEALCWHTGTPAIHEHAFSGAFRVMTGESVHTRYSFTERERLGPLTIGDLRLEHLELLGCGSIVEIPRGRGLIHSTFHLDSPTMTLVVRTHQGTEPEPTYLPPGVAYDSSARSHSLHKRLQLLDTLNRTAHASYLECVAAAIDASDIYDGLAIIMRAGSHRVDEPAFLGLAQHFCRRHGPRAAAVVPALAEERRRGRLARLRETVTDRDQRFFLATLLSFSHRGEMLAAMEQRYGDPRIARAQIVAGVTALLGGDHDRQLVTAAATEAVLDGVPAPVFSERAAGEWGRALTAEEAHKLATYYVHVLEHSLLAPLVRQ